MSKRRSRLEFVYCFCRPDGRRAYPREEGANAALEEMIARGKADHGRTYECHLGNWHCTSQSIEERRHALTVYAVAS